MTRGESSEPVGRSVQSTTVDLAACYTDARRTAPWVGFSSDVVAELPGGSQRFWGLPFDLGPEDDAQPGLVVAGVASSRSPILLPVTGFGSFVVFAHFCDARVAPDDPEHESVSSPVFLWSVAADTGELLANYVIVFQDGSEHVTPVRRRIEIGHPLGGFDQGRPFATRPHWGMRQLPPMGPYSDWSWSEHQIGLAYGPLTGVGSAWHLYALVNPYPDREIEGIRVEPTGVSAIAIGAVTLFAGQLHPLRHRRLETLEIGFSEGSTTEDAIVDVDLGVIGRRRVVQSFDESEWLGSPVRGRGEKPDADLAGRLMVDISASPSAILAVDGHDIEMAAIYEAGQATSDDGAIRVTALTTERTWVHGRIVDATTNRPTPARVHFRASDGRYLPPHGHMREINTNPFENFGADVKLGATSYAYVDGTFQGELPVGDVYVEVSKGFEYEPIRSKLAIKPGQRDLELRIERAVDLRSEGWVSADTHAHTLSPQTAHLEGQAEGLNIINLLAAQVVELPANIGDLTGRLDSTSSSDLLIWVGTENHQHIHGHMSLLGVRGEPVFPLSSGGPVGGPIGDPARRSTTAWAREARRRGGLAVYAHFPFPHGESIAAVVHGEVDAIEILEFGSDSVESFAYREYYRILSSGYRVPLVGGSDKFEAGRAIGEVRTYAYLGNNELTYDNWADAIRAGRTYATSGPLMSFSIEGRTPGDQIDLPNGGGSLHVEAEAISITAPVHRLEIVFNGKVVASSSAPDGATSIRLSERVRIPGSGWIAARCVSRYKSWSKWPTQIAAHTSPVYVEAGSEAGYDASEARGLASILEGCLAWLDTIATLGTPQEEHEIRQTLDDALHALARRDGSAREP